MIYLLAMLGLLGLILWNWGIPIVSDGNPLSDGYHLRENVSLWESEEVYVQLLLLPLFYLLSFIVGEVLLSGIGVVEILQFTQWTVVMGLILAVMTLPIWLPTMTGSPQVPALKIVRSAGFFTAITFGIGHSVTLAMVLNGDVSALKGIYQHHIILATNALRQFQAILGLSLPAIEPAITLTMDIYRNNAQLSLRALFLGLGGGLMMGLGAPLVLIIGVNAGVLFGVFTGIMIRNQLAIGGGVFTPVLGYFASMGLLIIGHTFHEFLAFMIAGVSGAFVTSGLWKDGSWFDTGYKAAIFGFGWLLFAAFLEVWIDPSFIELIKGYITIQPRVVPYDTYPISGAISTIVTVSLMILVTAWMVRQTVTRIEDVLWSFSDG